MIKTNNPLGPKVQDKAYNELMAAYIKHLGLTVGDVIPTFEFYTYCKIIANKRNKRGK